MPTEEGDKFLIELVSVFEDEGLKNALDGLGKVQKQIDGFVSKVKSLSGKAAASGRKFTDDFNKKFSYSTTQNIRRWGDFTHSLSDDFGIALNKISHMSSDWSRKWNNNVKSMVNQSAGAMSVFFNFTTDEFMKLDTLAKKVFESIMNAFFDMVGQMAAEQTIGALFGGFNLFNAGGGLLSGIEDLLGFRFGGTIPRTGPYMLHAGEYVLPSEVVESIRQSQRPSLSGGKNALASVSNASNLTLNQTVNLQSAQNGRQPNLKEIASQLKQASKEGITWAVDLAKVNYKIGKAGEGQISL